MGMWWPSVRPADSSGAIRRPNSSGQGYQVTSFDMKPRRCSYQLHSGPDCPLFGLRDLDGCRKAVERATEVYNVAAGMAGMGLIGRHNARRGRLVHKDQS